MPNPRRGLAVAWSLFQLYTAWAGTFDLLIQLPVHVAFAVVVGVVFVGLLLEASRRHIGGALVILALAFVVYAFVGPWLPGFLSHGGVTAIKLVDQQTLTTGGVFGIPTLVSATFIFLFVAFGAVMAQGGLLGFFKDLGLALAGSTRGGAGKVAVIASGLFGTVNGSAI